MLRPDSIPVLPRLLRLRDAPFYLGMDRNRFNRDVRPYITEISIGKQGKAYDRLELDAWVEQYKSRNGRRPKAPILEDDECLNVTICQDSALKVASGRSKNAVKVPKAVGFAKARDRLAALRQRST